MPLSCHPPESSRPYGPALWASQVQNQWYRDCSSLKGALDEQKNQEVSRFAPPSSGALEVHQPHEHPPATSDTHGESSGQLAHEREAQDVLERVPGSGTSESAPQDSYGQCGGNDDGFGTIADLDGEEPAFCMVGDCRYWHTDPKQVRRHRDSHFLDRFGYPCPNQENTCPSLGLHFRRRDSVIAHCRRYKACGDILKGNNQIIQCRGTPATEADLRPHNPNFHIPYKRSDGRSGRSGRKSQH